MVNTQIQDTYSIKYSCSTYFKEAEADITIQVIDCSGLSGDISLPDGFENEIV